MSIKLDMVLYPKGDTGVKGAALIKGGAHRVGLYMQSACRTFSMVHKCSFMHLLNVKTEKYLTAIGMLAKPKLGENKWCKDIP